MIYLHRQLINKEKNGQKKGGVGILKIKLEDIAGKIINEGENERTIKMLASLKSNIKREDFSVGVSIISPGKVHEEHFHSGSKEIIFVLAGEGIGKISGQELCLEVGDIIDIGDAEPHGFINTGDEDLKLLWIYSPPGPELRFC